ncbi:MAG TPA: DUF1990 domain-containing protein [Micrococcaceae bacterium]|nr:DUF1990 domain-containing protein [Micrococcaceae bacterium]
MRPGQGELTYPQRGLTRRLDGTGRDEGASEGARRSRDTPDDGGGWPDGYRRVEQRIPVGRGAEAYQRLAHGILDWGIQRGAGLTVRVLPGAGNGEAGTGTARTGEIGTGVTPGADRSGTVKCGARVACGFGLGRLRLLVPCEVVWVEQPGAVVVVLPGGEIQPQRAGFGYGTLPGHPASGEEAFIASIEADGTVYFGLLAFSKPSGLLYRLGSPVTRLAQRLVTRRYLRAARTLTPDPATAPYP